MCFNKIVCELLKKCLISVQRCSASLKNCLGHSKNVSTCIQEILTSIQKCSKHVLYNMYLKKIQNTSKNILSV